MLTLQKITNDNFRECVSLDTTEEQHHFVAKNLMSLAQAYVALTNGECIPMPYAIYEENTMIGFIMLTYEEKCEELKDQSGYSVWRFMIDQRYQGKGYGKEAFRMALDIIKSFPHGSAEQVVISYEPENKVAQKLYAAFGFRETGERCEDEVLAVLSL